MSASPPAGMRDREDGWSVLNRTHSMDARLAVPRATHVVVRPRLHVQLTAGLAAPCVLIAAPAGWGKTLLASSWLGSAAGPVARRGSRSARRTTMCVPSGHRLRPRSSPSSASDRRFRGRRSSTTSTSRRGTSLRHSPPVTPGRTGARQPARGERRSPSTKACSGWSSATARTPRFVITHAPGSTLAAAPAEPRV